MNTIVKTLLILLLLCLFWAGKVELPNNASKEDWLRSLNEQSEHLLQKFSPSEKGKKYASCFENIIKNRSQAACLERISQTDADYVLIDEEWDFNKQVYRVRDSYYFLEDSIQTGMCGNVYIRNTARMRFTEMGAMNKYSPMKLKKTKQRLPYLIYGTDLQSMKAIQIFFSKKKSIRAMPPFAWVYPPQYDCNGFSCGRFSYERQKQYLWSKHYKVPFVRVRTLISFEKRLFYQTFEYPVTGKPVIVR